LSESETLMRVRCPDCDGTGHQFREAIETLSPCPRCDGSGCVAAEQRPERAKEVTGSPEVEPLP